MAFCIDRAVWYFGRSVENDMDMEEQRLGDKAKANTKTAARQRVLNKYLMMEPGQVKGRYADPVSRARR